MTTSEIPDTELTPVAAWSQRVRKVGGFIQLAFAVFWLVRFPNLLAPTGGFAVLLGYAVATVSVAGFVLARRDA